MIKLLLFAETKRIEIEMRFAYAYSAISGYRRLISNENVNETWMSQMTSLYVVGKHLYFASLIDAITKIHTDL